ncbi:MAG TPA: dihydrolipoyl dehydrogenase [Kiritimatiellia bacterium]|nr:dihydrolipoyl dehydrogenase [Kiritimatiellia bacterium]HMP98124.1 dihydrolipoyl dehydrogenase [Kiritimatiellia bacterium]
MREYDVILIGSGGGAKITQALSRLGRRVALIEKDRAGGTCLNRGCIPSKMLIHPSGLVEKLRRAHKLKITAGSPVVDFEALVASINAYTDGVSDHLASGFERMDHVDYYQGEARFASAREVRVGEHRLTAEKIVIATGSRPFIPDIPGLTGTPFMTSTEALRGRKLPRRLIVIGGGYIAAELGGAYAGFGTAVTFLLRHSFLKREDPEVVAEFTKAFCPGKTVHENTRIDRVDYRGGLFTVACRHADGRSFNVEAEALLVATGITPNSDRLDLAAVGVAVRADGFIQVNDYLQTSVSGIYALGDVAGRYLFRHSVNFEAEYWVEANVIADAPAPIHYPPMPGAVFTHPEIASVGLTEPEAKRRGLDVVIARAHYPSCAMAVARGLEHGLVKLVLDRKTGRLLGAHIVGEEASTMIQELILAMTHGMTAAEVYRAIYIHPAFPEVIRNAIRDAIRQLDPRRGQLF